MIFCITADINIPTDNLSCSGAINVCYLISSNATDAVYRYKKFAKRLIFEKLNVFLSDDDISIMHVELSGLLDLCIRFRGNRSLAYYDQ